MSVAIGCALGVCLAGCPNLSVGDGSEAGGQGGSGAGSGCSPLSGVYRFSYALQSGSCSELPDELLAFAQGQLQPSATHSCRAGGVGMTNSCELRFDRSCSVSDPISGALLGSTLVTGALGVARDSQRAQGTLHMEIVDTSGAHCASSYAVSAVRVQ